jgi:hypothetical protein
MPHYEPDPKLMYEAAEQADPILKAQNQSAPRWLQGETHMGYRRRLAEKIQSHAPNCQDFKIGEAQGSAFDVLEKQIYDDARREAQRPTQVPEGELREVRRTDQAGRPFIEFYGKPSVWLSQFHPGSKRVVGIKTQTERGYHPSNVG